MIVKQKMDKSLEKIKLLFKYSGMHMEDREVYYKEMFIYIFHFLWIGMDILGAFSWIYEGINKGRSFIELTHVTPCLNMGMIAEFKMYYYVKNYRKVHELIKTLRELERKNLVKAVHVKNIVKEEIQFLNAVINILGWFSGVLLILFDFGPLVLIGVRYLKTNEVELLLPFLDIYPFDCYDPRFWPFAYFHQMYTAFIVITEILANDFFFYICCTHVRIQFRILQYEIENIVPKSGTKGMLQKIKENLNEWIRSHQAVISSAATLETLYSKSTLFNYISSSIIICLTGFNVTTVEDKAIVVTFACIFIMNMLQILFLCFFGNILMISSTDVNKATYNCRWYLADTDFRRNILTIIIRSKKPCKLTAAGFADVNLNAFMKILSTSWSYFALLQTVYSSSRD